MSVAFNTLMDTVVARKASDLYLTAGMPPCIRIEGVIEQFGTDRLTSEDIMNFLATIVSEEVMLEFDSTLEYNTAFTWQGQTRFRINMFRQQQQTGVVMRRIQTIIPTLEELGLPPKVYGRLAMEKRGLILVVGPTGSGKSSTLAAMLESRNQHGSGHIITIEDPVEFVFTPKNCIITQRDVGIDTYSFGIALKNTLRQTPDVIVIGEIRDRDAMEHAITFSETGHLCLATLHANNANQAIERIINFFPEERHKQILLNLSLNLKGILSQRLMINSEEKRSVALEILLNQGVIRDLIQEGRVKEIKEHMERGRDMGMQTFEQSLLDLYTAGTISEAVALTESDNPANLRLAMKQHEMQKTPIASRTLNMPDLEITRKNIF